MTKDFQNRCLKTLRAAILDAYSPWCDYETAAHYTGYSVMTIRRWVQAGLLPENFATGSDRPRFLKKDLDAVMSSGMKRTK